MLVHLKIAGETPKAYKLEGDGWIPKSVLDARGLKHPYYQVQDWWLGTFVEKGFEEKLTEQDKLTLESLGKCQIKHIDLPQEVKEYWQKYWSSMDSGHSGGLDHYNDIGAMNDLSFQDLYDGH